MLHNAFVILRNARGPVLVYGALLAAYGYTMLGILRALAGTQVLEPESPYGAIIDVALALSESAVTALLMSVCFSRVARTVEGALWKVAGPLDAVRRFFALWFVLMLVRTLVVRLVELTSGPIASPEDAAPTLLTNLLLTSWIVPVGAFIMFHGRGERLTLEDLRQGFHAMGTHFGTVLVIVLVNFALLLITELARAEIPREFRPLFAFVNALRVVYIFACAWVMGIYHRDHYEPDTDFDF